jgi:hypothetical protein
MIGCLFYNALSVTTLYSVDDGMISEWWWIGKDLAGSGRGQSWRSPGIHLEVLRKTTRNVNQDSRSLGPRFEPGTSRLRSKSVIHSITTFGDDVILGSEKNNIVVLECWSCVMKLSALKMQAACFSEMVVSTYESTLCHNLKEKCCHPHRRGGVKCHTVIIVFGFCH